MKPWVRSAVCFLALSALLALGAQVTLAQDLASEEASPSSGVSAVKLDPNYRAPVVTHGGNLLYDNGPFINLPGGGLGGADASVLQSGTLGMNSFGFNHDPEEFHVADDFTVSDPVGWDIDSLVFFAYQTLSGTTSTIIDLKYQIWDGIPSDPGSSVIYGDLVADRLTGTAWDNTYRVTETTLSNADRPVMRNQADGGATLMPGTYWIEWATEGTLTSGPWTPPITITGQSTTGDALSFSVATQTWAPLVDGATQAPQGLPFLIYGTALSDTAGQVTFSPSSMAFTLSNSEADSMVMTITNTGGGDLTYTLSDEDVPAFRLQIVPPVEQRHVELRKGEADLREGDPQVYGMGGPDTFGHFWIDSDEPGGPTFSWMDITGTGTAIVLTDDDFEEVALPFTFNFYGVDKSLIKISSNGYLTFGPDGTDFTNDPIPNPTDPNDFIAPFWTDMNPAIVGSGPIHYQGSSTEFIVQYTNVPPFGGTAGIDYTFQVILYPNGEVLYQYLDMSATLVASTIGIEDATASDGLQVVFNAAYVHNNLATRVYIPSAGDPLAQYGVCYGSTGHNDPTNPGSLITIDPVTGAGTLVGSTGITGDFGAAVPALAIKTTGEMYATSVRTSSDLYLIDASTGAATLVGNTGLFYPDALAFDGNGVLYAIDSNNNLYTIDESTGTATLIGPVGENVRGMEFDPTTGILWGGEGGAGGSNDGIFTINVTTGAATLVGNTGLGSNTPAVHFDQAGNLYGTNGGGGAPNDLISINKTTGVGTTIGPIGFTAVAGMSARNTFGAGAGAPWLSENPTGGTLPSGESADIQIIANSTGLAPGDYTANVIISSNDPDNPDTTMPVMLTVLANDPEISVAPTSINQTLITGDSIDVTITISNIGLGDLDWSAAITSSSLRGTTSTGKKVELTTTPSPVVQLRANTGSQEGTVGRQTLPPPVDQGGISLILDDGTNEDDVGIGGGQWLWLNRYTPAPADFPFTLNEVQLLFDDQIGVDVGEIVDIYVYEDTDGDGDPGTGEVHLGSVIGAAVQAADGITWSVYATPAIVLNGPGDVLIAVATRTAGTNANEFPAAIDQTVTQLRSWAGIYTGNPPDPPFFPADALWGEIGSFGIPGNWMIRGFGTQGGGGGPEWISLIGATSGTITPGGSADLTVRLRAGDMPATFNGTIDITSNDPANPTVTVPVMLTVMALGPEPLLSLVHTPGNFNMGIFNDGSIGADNVNFIGPGVSWRGNNGCFVGGPIFGTSAVGSVNGLIGSFSISGDLVNLASNFAGGFSSNANFNQIASADLDDSGAPVPYGVGILQRSYTNTDEEFGLIRYGYVNNTASTLQDFYAGIFTDWDVIPYATNSGGVDEGRNLIYTFNTTGTIAYFGFAALDGLSGGRTTTLSPPAPTRDGSFDWITMLESTIPANGDFREWIGTGPTMINPGDTLWVTFAVIAGDNLVEIQTNADAALAKALAVGFIDDTGLDDELGGMPREFALAQNYPNPFNPATRIAYALPEQSTVTIKVYNLVGQLVTTLANGVQEAGYHFATWNGRNNSGTPVSSGVYFYRFEASGSSGKNFTDLKKMLFLK